MLAVEGGTQGDFHPPGFSPPQQAAFFSRLPLPPTREGERMALSDEEFRAIEERWNPEDTGDLPATAYDDVRRLLAEVRRLREELREATATSRVRASPPAS